MLLPNMKTHTIDDIYALPDGQRAELIDGRIYSMAPPSFLHQRLVSEFTQTIGQYIKSNNSLCMVLPAPFAVFLNRDDKTYVEPDISVICDRNKLDDRGCNGAPDWIIEIVSPSSKRIDYFTKLFKYRTAGVKEYWIVNPENHQILVYDFVNDNEKSDTYSFTDTIQVGIYDNLFINVANLIQ